MPEATFERLSAQGRAAVLAGTHQVEVPPFDGGRRFGLSAVFRPDAETAGALDALTSSGLAMAGEQHWATGSAGTAHVTIRGLEPHRVPVPHDDPIAARYASALTRATRDLGAVRFELCGLVLTPSSVMIRATPSSAGAARVRSAFDRALGDDGGFEARFQRDIWYLSLVHFAGPIARPSELVEWVEARSTLRVGDMLATRAELVRWEFDGRRMVPSVLAEARLDG